ncbi:hypothetical protein DFH06DRAFT_1327350 [Mycena polygramma]|nr:hypothetical protein DFH06DRAFT_1327350 [Mycena polygramma]
MRYLPFPFPRKLDAFLSPRGKYTGSRRGKTPGISPFALKFRLMDVSFCFEVDVRRGTLLLRLRADAASRFVQSVFGRNPYIRRLPPLVFALFDRTALSSRWVASRSAPPRYIRTASCPHPLVLCPTRSFLLQRCLSHRPTLANAQARSSMFSLRSDLALPESCRRAASRPFPLASRTEARVWVLPLVGVELEDSGPFRPRGTASVLSTSFRSVHVIPGVQCIPLGRLITSHPAPPQRRLDKDMISQLARSESPRTVPPFSIPFSAALAVRR